MPMGVKKSRTPRHLFSLMCSLALISSVLWKNYWPWCHEDVSNVLKHLVSSNGQQGNGITSLLLGEPWNQVGLATSYGPSLISIE